MWVKREEYEELVKYKQDNTADWIHYRTQIDHLTAMYWSEQEKNKELTDKCEYHKSLCEEYKQKYADEVQKRLELVKLLKNTP